MEIEKATIVVVLVIGVMSSRYWAMEAQVRESVSENERVKNYINIYTGQVWIISIPYPIRFYP